MSGGVSVNGESLQTDANFSSDDEVELHVSVEVDSQTPIEGVQPVAVLEYVPLGQGMPAVLYELTQTGLIDFDFAQLGHANSRTNVDKKHHKQWFKGKLPVTSYRVTTWVLESDNRLSLK